MCVSEREIAGTHRVFARHSRSPLAGPLATLPALGHLRQHSATSVATPPTTIAGRDLYREPRRDNHAVAGARLSVPLPLPHQDNLFINPFGDLENACDL